MIKVLLPLCKVLFLCWVHLLAVAFFITIYVLAMQELNVLLVWLLNFFALFDWLVLLFFFLVLFFVLVMLSVLNFFEGTFE